MSFMRSGAWKSAERRQLTAWCAWPTTRQYSAAAVLTTHDVAFCSISNRNGVSIRCHPALTLLRLTAILPAISSTVTPSLSPVSPANASLRPGSDAKCKSARRLTPYTER